MVPAVVVVSSGSFEVVGAPGDGVSGGNSVAVEVPVVVNVVVVVVVRRTVEDDVVGDIDVDTVLDGAVECRDVCRTAYTRRTTASRPATAAAITTGGCSNH